MEALDPRLPPIEVEAVSGARADERPRRVRRGDRWLEVREILRAETIEDSRRRRFRRFLVELEDGSRLEVLLDEQEGAWYAGG